MKKLTECQECKKPTSNPKFCSRSCHIRTNNRLKPKKEKIIKHCCLNCGKPKPVSRKTCLDCKPNIDWSKATLNEAKKAHKHQYYNRIREISRRLYKHRFKSCHQCGYDKHVEICHIKAISSYPEDTLVSEINNENNIIALCPNCHWEFDHGVK